MLSAKKRPSEKRLALGVRQGVAFVAPETAEDDDDWGGAGKEPDPLYYNSHRTNRARYRARAGVLRERRNCRFCSPESCTGES
jgi:hypothetical protein